jgi:Holliday junction resolvase RusA-like endonuclease
VKQVQITVPGEPVAKARTKHRAIHTGAFYYNKTKGRQEEKIIPQEYTPAQSVSFENLVRTVFVSQCRDQPWAGPCLVDVCAYLQAPKSLRVSDRQLAEVDGLPHVKKPDGDNIMKAVKDGLRSVAYVDDNQVVDGHYRKIYSYRPRTEISITFLTMEEACLQLRQTSALSSAPCGSPTTKRTPSDLILSPA